MGHFYKVSDFRRRPRPLDQSLRLFLGTGGGTTAVGGGQGARLDTLSGAQPSAVTLLFWVKVIGQPPVNPGSFLFYMVSGTSDYFQLRVISTSSTAFLISPVANTQLSPPNGQTVGFTNTEGLAGILVALQITTNGTNREFRASVNGRAYCDPAIIAIPANDTSYVTNWPATQFGVGAGGRGCYIGFNQSFQAAFSDIRIGEVDFINKALTSSELLGIYNGGRFSYYRDTVLGNVGSTLRYKMEHTTGVTTLTDSSGNNRTATIYPTTGNVPQFVTF